MRGTGVNGRHACTSDMVVRRCENIPGNQSLKAVDELKRKKKLKFSKMILKQRTLFQVLCKPAM